MTGWTDKLDDNDDSFFELSSFDDTIGGNDNPTFNHDGIDCKTPLGLLSIAATDGEDGDACPFMNTFPSLGDSIPAIKRNTVDLPLADRPTKRVTPFSFRLLPAVYCLVDLSKSSFVTVGDWMRPNDKVIF